MYNDWLSALRTLSAPKEEPKVAATEPWGRRILSTQLASWAQLRHNTVLYAKQSYSTGVLCEFPDAAVDPYPELYAELVRYAEHGLTLKTIHGGLRAPYLVTRIMDYFGRLRTVASQLHGIANAQLEHRALNAEQLAFVNDAVVMKSRTESLGCGAETEEWPEGWYVKLFYGDDALLYKPTVADVHTQPTDEDGDTVGRILHVGTGSPREIVVTFDGCNGTPRAFVGMVSSYRELVTDGWKRLTDDEWAEQLLHGSVPEPTWMSGLVSP